MGRLLRSPGLVLAPLAAGWLACGGPAPRDGGASAAARQAIIGGAPAPDDRAVFLLRMFDAAGDESICSATLISKQTLLTAAHCVDDPALVIFATNALDGYDTPQTALVKVTRFQVHPGWDPAHPDFDFQFDVAVAKLEAAPAVTPIPFSGAPLDGFAGKPVRAIGYGVTDPKTSSEGSRRAVDLVVDDLTAGHLYLGDGQARGFCYGDSGGPTVHRFPDGVERVVGVHSFNWSKDCTYGGDTRLDLPAHVAFVNGWLQEQEPPVVPSQPPKSSVGVGGPAGDPLPPSEAGGCSAAPGALGWTLALTLLGVLARRRSPARSGVWTSAPPPARG